MRNMIKRTLYVVIIMFVGVCLHLLGFLVKQEAL